MKKLEMEFLIDEAMYAINFVDQTHFKYLVNLARQDHRIIEEIYIKCLTDNRRLVSFINAVGVDYEFPGGENLLTYLSHCACFTECPRTLIKFGVDRHHKNDRGQNALDIAFELGHRTKIHTLVDFGLVRTPRTTL